MCVCVCVCVFVFVDCRYYCCCCCCCCSISARRPSSTAMLKMQDWIVKCTTSFCRPNCSFGQFPVLYFSSFSSTLAVNRRQNPARSFSRLRTFRWHRVQMTSLIIASRGLRRCRSLSSSTDYTAYLSQHIWFWCLRLCQVQQSGIRYPTVYVTQLLGTINLNQTWEHSSDVNKTKTLKTKNSTKTDLKTQTVNCFRV